MNDKSLTSFLNGPAYKLLFDAGVRREILKFLAGQEIGTNVGGTFAALSGSVLTGNYKQIDLTGNVVLTTDSTTEVGTVFLFIQDSSGSHTASLNGTSLPITSTANARTFIILLQDKDGNWMGTKDTTYFAINATPVANTAPTASSVAFTGTATEGQTLTGTYTYSDADSDTEGATIKQWYRSDDTSATNRVAISGATNSTYVLQSGDVGKYIQFAVTPVASSGVATGTKVYSSYSTVIATLPANSAPTASSVNITGTQTQGSTLTGHYTYADIDSDVEGTSTFKWYRADNNSGLNRAAISGATSSTYVLQAGDVGKYIQFGVIPIAATGTSPGSEALSTYTGAIVASSSNPYVTAVIGAGGSLSSQVQTAIDTMDAALVTAGLKAKLDRLELRRGGTAASAAIEYLTATAKTTFTGSPTFDADGADYNGTSQYGIWDVNPRTDISLNDVFFGAWNIKASHSVYDMGCGDGVGNEGLAIAFSRPSTGTRLVDCWNGSVGRSSAPSVSDSRGFVAANRTDSTHMGIVQNGVTSAIVFTAVPSSPDPRPNTNIYEGAFHDYTTPTIYYGDCKITLSWLGHGFDSTDASNFYDIMHQFLLDCGTLP